jgi:FkbM family methyltransferase
MKLYFKVIIVKFLTSRLIGKTIKRFNNGILYTQGIKIDLTSSEISPRAAASIFWGFYESAEIRFIKKFLMPNLPIVELGTSIGIVACIARTINRQKLICVEANPTLIPLIQKNFELNKIENYEIINAAIGNETNESLYFEKGSSNTTGKVNNIKTESSVLIKQVTLTEILQTRKIQDYILICDIEGAEVFLLMNDHRSLSNCKQIIIETHEKEFNNNLIKSADMKDRIIELGFVVREQYGPNFVFEKPDVVN